MEHISMRLFIALASLNYLQHIPHNLLESPPVKR